MTGPVNSSPSEKSPNESFAIFLSMNIVQILFTSIGMISAIFFIIAVFVNRSIHTVSNILTCNSSIAVLILASNTFAIAANVLYRDLSPGKVSMNNMFLCQLRGYLSHISFCALVHSFVIQSFYRLAGIVLYDRLYYQSLRPYLYAIVVQWIIAVVQVLPIVVTNNQEYIEEEYLCQIAISNTRAIGYVCAVVYVIPLALIIFQYWIIARYSRRNRAGVHPISIQQRARRQMKLIRRILILILILLTLGTPYCTIITLDALSIQPAPRFAHRLGFLFVGIASGCIMLMLIYFTRNLRRLLLGKRKDKKGRTPRRFRDVVQSETVANDQPLI